MVRVWEDEGREEISSLCLPWTVKQESDQKWNSRVGDLGGSVYRVFLLRSVLQYITNLCWTYFKMFLCCRLFVSGGIITSSGSYKTKGQESSSVEYSEDGITFKSLPPMPEAKSGHCMAVLDDGNLFVAGDGKSCFLYQSERKAWMKCPDMTTERGGKRFTNY
jgi:hypothetical protein